jgi:hypothetical protein
MWATNWMHMLVEHAGKYGLEDSCSGAHDAVTGGLSETKFAEDNIFVPLG